MLNARVRVVLVVGVLGRFGGILFSGGWRVHGVWGRGRDCGYGGGYVVLDIARHEEERGVAGRHEGETLGALLGTRCELGSGVVMLGL